MCVGRGLPQARIGGIGSVGNAARIDDLQQLAALVALWVVDAVPAPAAGARGGGIDRLGTRVPAGEWLGVVGELGLGLILGGRPRGHLRASSAPWSRSGRFRLYSAPTYTSLLVR